MDSNNKVEVYTPSVKIEVVWKKLYCNDCRVEMQYDIWNDARQTVTDFEYAYHCPKCGKLYYTKIKYPVCDSYKQYDMAVGDTLVQRLRKDLDIDE